MQRKKDNCDEVLCLSGDRESARWKIRDQVIAVLHRWEQPEG
jgi:hypothetical protein